MPEPELKTEAQVLADCNLVTKPPVEMSMYWLEISLLGLSILTPFVAYLIGHDADTVERSGSLMLFFAAVAESSTLRRINHKHILNVCRVQQQERPWDFSRAYHVVGWVSLLVGSAGTLLWGFGQPIWCLISGTW